MTTADVDNQANRGMKGRIGQLKRSIGNTDFFRGKTPDFDGFLNYVDQLESDALTKRQWLLAADAIRSIELEGGKNLLPDDLQLIESKQVLNFIITTGRMKTARTYLDLAGKRWNREKFRIDKLLLGGPDTDEILPDIDLRWKDFQFYDYGHKTTMMLFCGVTHVFGTELNIMMQWMRRLPVNVAFVRDFSGRIYLGGLRSMETLENTISTIGAKLAEIGNQRLVCMGNSGGTYGALYFGHLLGAQQVLCFAGPTNLSVGFSEKSDRPVYERLKVLIDNGEVTEPDLRVLYRANQTKAHYFHGEDFIFDKMQADHMAGIDNFVAHPISDHDKHFVLGVLAERGLFGDILRNAAVG